MYLLICCLYFLGFVQVSLVATAPLTNLAMAVKLDPSLPEKLKALYIMGGNTECRLSCVMASFSKCSTQCLSH